MSKTFNYFFKIANNNDEFEQIYQLNYQTFSEEIPQHEQNAERKLIDPFHDENTYIICLKERELVGMVAVRSNRPFSLDRKIGPVEESLPFTFKQPCEIRLLAVKKEYRNGQVFFGLVQFLVKYCLKKGCDIAFISGTVRQLKLYRHMGFKPFSHLTGTEDARYQPMFLTKQTFELSLAGRTMKKDFSFLPGPVAISDNVHEALNRAPYSHRSEHFHETITATKKQLCQLVNSQYVQILTGTGTLANDVVAAQLSLVPGKGLILTNGEFGRRLVEQARRLGLRFNVLNKEWGEPFSKEEIVEGLLRETTWIWAVHSETSTGMLNDLELLKEISSDYDIKLCLDCISSIGAIPVDLEGVYLTTGVSGKALHSFTGLSFVFHHHEVGPSPILPAYLDLGTYMEKGSIPFSASSNLVEALHSALENISEETFVKTAESHQWLKKKLRERGFQLVTDGESSSPIIVTIELPKSIPSVEIGSLLYYYNYHLHYESDYLKARNWIQIACINDYPVAILERMLELLSMAKETFFNAAYQQSSIFPY
ncbi:aminotransferase class V-fold PLP-dependent enzyme [Neobacillus mesonae]|uniref:aminotransferase class V-fold PLP-dependent enzyme n=1 Tax=Neobacillus mesonae TaxID=1193713 RepID=UPI002040A15C|nr:aminotransferase class V-fold PLP-dependent enzyme [Neobacillus mesonae]MCM3569323.1 aminotransferase class V-fold PLP-dependent enzyme [Neobacillus mesonae]